MLGKAILDVAGCCRSFPVIHGLFASPLPAGRQRGLDGQRGERLASVTSDTGRSALLSHERLARGERIASVASASHGHWASLSDERGERLASVANGRPR